MMGRGVWMYGLYGLYGFRVALCCILGLLLFLRSVLYVFREEPEPRLSAVSPLNPRSAVDSASAVTLGVACGVELMRA